jgi:hypothetical protein
MKKNLRFLYRYVTTGRRWRRWFNFQTLLLLAVSAVFITTLAWTSPYSADRDEGSSPQLAGAQQQPTPTDDPEAGPTRTPFPPEYLDNSRQTIGITLGATMLVLIVIIGVLLFIPHKNDGTYP